jgi:hypothetical protein
MNRKYDYDKLEFEYIQGDMSLRELADSAGMSSHSMIMEASVKRGWKQKREEFRSRASSKGRRRGPSDRQGGARPRQRHRRHR